jgi:hypothetical protein
MKQIKELWVIIRQVSWKENERYYIHTECIGFNPDTDEDYFEDTWEETWDPHEEYVATYSSYDDAREKYMSMTKEYEDSHNWPWNNGHVSIENGEFITEFTNNESFERLILRKYVKP